MTVSTRCSAALTEAGQKVSPLLLHVCLTHVSSSADPLPGVPRLCCNSPPRQQALLDPAPQVKLLQLRDQPPPASRPCQSQMFPRFAQASAPELPAPSPRSAPAASPPLAGAGAAREEEPPPPRFLRPSPPGGSGAWHRLRQLRSFLEPPSAGSLRSGARVRPAGSGPGRYRLPDRDPGREVASMVPPAVLLPWVVLALLGAECGGASEQEGKGGCLLRGRGWGLAARGAGGPADGRARPRSGPPLSLAPRSSSEALPDPRVVPAAEPEPLGGI